MAATLARMERDGLVERRPDPKDRRSSLVSLTPAAREKLNPLRSAVERMNVDALAGFPPEDQQRFRMILENMIASLERAFAEEARSALHRSASCRSEKPRDV